MIVEFLGPPASGKTTMAVALAARLRAGGNEVQLKLSSRPGEETKTKSGMAQAQPPIGASLRRLTRPVQELVSVVVQSPPDPSDARCTDLLTAGLGRGQFFRSIRMRQYLVRLASAWSTALKNQKKISIFDQGYAQVAATIMLHQPGMSDADIGSLLVVMPQADLVVRVDTDIAEIESRLAHRQSALGAIGRMFEEDLGDVHRQAQAVARLYGLMSQRGRPVISIASNDATQAEAQIGNLQRAVLAKAFLRASG